MLPEALDYDPERSIVEMFIFLGVFFFLRILFVVLHLMRIRCFDPVWGKIGWVIAGRPNYLKDNV